jgi:anti-sigma-K factor RskA
VIQSVGGRVAWWLQPLPALAALCALVIAVAGGWMWGSRHSAAPSIAFAPVYRLEIPRAPQPETQTVVKEVQVHDPAEAQAIAALNQDLSRERQKSDRLEADLNQQRTLVASAQRAAQDAEQRYRAAIERKSVGDDLQQRLASLNARTQELERQVNQYRALLEIQRKRLDQNLLLASMVSDPALRIVRLRATEKSKTVEGHALIAGSSQLVFYASQLPALPANRVYQLWLIRSRGQAIASAGIFQPDSAHRATVQLSDPALLTNLTTLAVTDEPAGGSPQPTGNKWLIGS